MDNIKPGLYRHYKGDLYHVIGVCRHTETLEECVIYQSLYGDYGLWVRPLAMFQESIEYNNQPVSRFTFVKEFYTQAPSAR